ncbi:molecular chaperone HtpG [Telmatospirillum sp. J64-1]|uniref:molecular chaperone HtpG n=1 Tax=Telmatospirillum sp. J64-1 TaxID=2502183 RepID=UPI00115EFBC3|nr:molecular chaperone HtpG [Telmatospirillum sp. J64-1]
MAQETLNFQAEVSKLLEIVVHSLYSNKEIFLRELVSNASDACDKLRYAALTQPELVEGDSDYKIRLIPDKQARTLTIADNGIGMNKADLVENLGTIARSGTANFLSQLSGDAKKDVTLIGQFGVGFYSAFMVADKVEVITRKAGESEGWRWTSDGRGAFTIAEDESAGRGARIVLHLRDGEDEFLESQRLRHIVKTYSDHIALPVLLVEEEGKEERLNAASALWTRSKSEVTPEQYREFYHHVAHAFDEPWLTLHYKAEGAIEYTGLLFIPSHKPFDLFHPDRKQHVKLYVKRVFITDDCADLLPPYLRFLRGVVDSQDLPLNISREMLQHNPVLAKIRTGLVKRVLSELKKRAEDENGNYDAFWNEFGAVLKEGLYEERERRDEILPLCRFRSTKGDGLVSLKQYVERMKPGQEAIYTITGDDPVALRKSPQLEGFLARDVEVLLLTDPIDEFWVSAVGSFEDKPFRSVAQAGTDLGAIAKEEKEGETPEPEAAPAKDMDTLIAALKLALGEQVKDVRPSERLTESAVCLVSDQGEMSLHLERLLRQHQQLGQGAPRILEINPRHALIRRLAEKAGSEGAGGIEDAAHLLLDQARILEGETLPDPAAFARRMAAALEKGLA